MRYTAILKTSSCDARNVSEALDVDNISLKDLEIETRADEEHIITTLKSDNPRTLLNTLDDLISCQMTAEKLLTKNG